MPQVNTIPFYIKGLEHLQSLILTGHQNMQCVSPDAESASTMTRRTVRKQISVYLQGTQCDILSQCSERFILLENLVMCKEEIFPGRYQLVFRGKTNPYLN